MKRKTGFILILVMIFIVVLFLLGGGIAALAFPEFFFINQQAAKTTALHIADAGVTNALYRMEKGYFSNFSATLRPALPGGAPVYGTYSVSITPDAGNDSSALKLYHIVSTATLNSRPSVTRTVKAVVDNRSFAQYLYFSNSEKPSYTGTRQWFKLGEQLDGPVHSNDIISINWNNSNNYPPLFLKKVSTARSFNWSPASPEQVSAGQLSAMVSAAHTAVYAAMAAAAAANEAITAATVYNPDLASQAGQISEAANEAVIEAQAAVSEAEAALLISDAAWVAESTEDTACATQAAAQAAYQAADLAEESGNTGAAVTARQAADNASQAALNALCLAGRDDYQEIFQNGQKDSEIDLNPISYPPSSSSQESAALANLAEPSQNGIYLPNQSGQLNGGIYLRGTVKRMRLSVDASNNQVIQITQKIDSIDKTASITLNESSNTTTFTDYNNATFVYQGLPKGVLFSNKSIEDFAGTVKSQLTVITELNPPLLSPKNYIKITDNVRYSVDPVANPNFTGRLGLIANKIIISKNAPANLAVQAAVMAADSSFSSGTLSVEDLSGMAAKGYLRIYGSVSQEYRGNIGLVDSYTGSLISGYLRDYRHDKRFLQNPPPYFPTTGKYRVYLWRDLH